MKRLALFIGASLLTLVILLALVFGTPFGARTALWGANFIPFLSATYLDGQLNRGLQLADVVVDLPGIYVRVDRLDTAWRAPCVLNRQACFDRFHAEGVVVAIDTDEIGGRQDQEPPPQPESGPEPLPLAPGEYRGMPLPLTILARDLALTDVAVRVNDMSYNANYLAGAAEVSSTLIWVNWLNLEGADVHIPLAAGDPEAIPAPTADEAERWAMAHLPDVDLPFEIRVDSALATDGQVLVGWMEHEVERLEFRGSWQHTRLDLPFIQAIHNWADLKGRIAMDFRDGYGLDAQLSGTVDELPWQPELSGHRVRFSGQGRLTDLTARLESEGPLSGQLDLAIRLGDPTLPYELKLVADTLEWPLGGAPLHRARDVTLESRGDLNRQTFAVTGLFQSDSFDDTRLQLVAEHDHQQLVIHQGEIEGPMGAAWLDGQVSLAAPWQWDLNLRARQLDLAQLDARLALQLDGQAHSRGRIDEELWQLAIDDADLTGRWLDYPLSLKGSLAVDQRLRGYAHNLEAELNQTRLQLDGEIVEGQWQLSGALTAQNLGVWTPDLQGRARADIALAGPADNPRLHLAAHAEQLVYQQVSSDHLVLVMDHWPLDNFRFDAALATNGVLVADYDLGALSVTALGDRFRQDMDLDLHGRERLRASLGGNLYDDGKHWRGALLRGRVTTDYGEWETNLPALMDLRPFDGDLVLGDHCWQGTGTELCLPYPIRLGPRGAVALDLRSDLAQSLAPLLPERLTMDAGITGQVYLAWQPEQLPYVRAEWQADEGVIKIAHTGGLADSQIRWTDIDTRLAMGQAGVEIFNFIRLADRQAVELEINLGPEPPYSLSGKLRADDLDITPFLALDPNLSDAAARITSDLTFAGNLERPEIQGQLRLDDGQISTYANPTRVTGINFDVDFSGKDTTLKGDFAVGPGKGSLDGKLAWQQGLGGQINLKGDNLQLVYPPMLVLDASPDLRFDLAPGKLKIRGDILVPKGSLTVNALPEGTVKLSNDVVYVDERDDSDDKLGTTLDMDVNLVIRNRLKVEAFGVTGNMAGELDLRQKPSKPFQMFGDLNLEGGRFQAFGQRLEIRKGRFNFTGPPALPRIDAEAVREIEQENVIAGVRISGTADAPQLTLFSNPAMEQQEILSYITQGRGLNAQDSGGSIFTATALGFGVNTTGGVVSRIGKGVGLRDLAVDTEGDGTDTLVTVSAYVGEDLFVKYGVGVIGESVNEISVRYYLTQRLWLEMVNEITETTEQSLDLFYSFDID